MITLQAAVDVCHQGNPRRLDLADHVSINEASRKLPPRYPAQVSSLSRYAALGEAHSGSPPISWHLKQS